MSIVERNWQMTRSTIREKVKFMFNNDLFSDVKFVLPKAIGERESNQVIPAHKFVLSISSPVFEAMFYGDLAETRDSIELPDCEHESLLELFRYMYSDEVNLNGSNVMGVLYLAKKYMVPSLAEECTKYLESKLGPSNVFSILPQVQQFEEKTLTDRCWKVIDQQTNEAVKSDGFATIERSLLESLVERDTLNIEEIELFRAVNLWASKICEEQDLSTDGSEKRRILGERILKGIRFPVMKKQEFVGAVLECNILTQDEASCVLKYLNSEPDAEVGFSVDKRSGLELFHRCCRFQSVELSGWSYPVPKKRDCLLFKVDKDISLLGVTLYGSKGCKYTTTILLRRSDDNNQYHDLCTKSVRNYVPVCIKSKPVSYYGFEIFFNRPVVIRKDVFHRIEAGITGANSCYGENGQWTVHCSGVRFDFEYSARSENGTSVWRGQFPEFLFTVELPV